MKRETHQSYREKMLDSRWRDFCISVMSQPKFQNGDLCGAYCENCESRERLQVHHLGYREHAEPWEYDFSEVMVLLWHCLKMNIKTRRKDHK